LAPPATPGGGAASSREGRSAPVPERIIHLAFACALVCLGGIGIVAFRSVHQLRESAAWVRHTDQVIAEHDRLLATISAAESAQRRYLITGEESDLEISRADREQTADAMRRLRTLTGDDAGQQRRIEVLAPLVTERIAALQEVVAIRRADGFAAARAALATGRGPQLQDRVRALIAEGTDNERQLLRAREGRAEQTTRMAQATILGGSGLALVFVAVAQVLIRRDFAGSRRATLALQEAHDHLETRVQERTAALAQKNESLRASEHAQRQAAEATNAILNALPAQIALLDPLGRIVAVNESWGAFAVANALQGTDFFIGRNYLEVCDAATGDCSEEARAVAAGLRAVLTGQQPSFALEYPCHSPEEQRWFRVMATPVSAGAKAGAVVMHVDITERKISEKRLRDSEERFRTMVNSIFQLAWMGRADGFIIWYNQRWYDYTGTTPEQMEGWGWQSVHDPARLPEVVARWTESIALGKPFEMELPLRGADGRFRLFLTRGIPLRDATGQIVQWFGTNTDVDEIRHAEAALRDEQARLAGLIDAAMDAIVTVDAAQTIVRVNPAAEAMFGWPAAQILGQPLARLIPARFGARHAEEVRAFGSTGASSRRMGALGAVWGVRADGQEFPVEASISQVEVGGEKFYTAILRDVTERQQAEAELRRTSEEMRALARHLEVIREEQAAHIARELHDELGQTLTILKLHVRAMQKRLEAHPDEPPSFEAREAVELIEASIRSLRHLCLELRPPMLDHLGLGLALGTLAADFQTHSGITCTLEAPAEFPPLDAPRQATVYRLVQELLTNVARHSGANEVRIALRYGEETLEVQVVDNGRGISVAEQTGAKSLGLLGMRERALAAGGSIEIEGCAGRGTTAVARIPLAPPPAAP